jgi:ribose transport system substrate-binding protein
MKAMLQALLVVSLLVVAGCGGEQEPVASGDNRPTVALIMKSLANEFFVNMAEGAEQHQLQHADQYDLIVNGLKDESDLTQQVALVEQMAARGVDIIVIAPADSKALIPVLKRAMQGGIVVVNIDNKIDAALLSLPRSMRSSDRRDSKMPWRLPVSKSLAFRLEIGSRARQAPLPQR